MKVEMFMFGALLAVFVALIMPGCISNNSYTNSGEGDPRVAVGKADMERKDSEIDTKMNTKVEAEVSGVKHDNSRKQDNSKTRL